MLKFDDLFDDDFFSELEKLERKDGKGTVESIQKAKEEFKQSDEYQEFKADVKESTDIKANYKGKNVQEIMGLTDRRQSVGYSFNALDHYDIDLEIYEDILEQSPVMQHTLQEGENLLKTFRYLHEDIFLSLLKYKAVVLPEGEMHSATRLNRQIILNLINTPEYISLRKTCRLDQFNAALGTEILGRTALEAIKKMIEKIKDFQQKQQKMDELLEQEQKMDELLEEMEDIDELLAEAKRQGNNQMISDLTSQKSDAEQAMQTSKALANEIAKECDELLNDDDLAQEVSTIISGALTEADKEVGEVSDLCEAWGLSSGGIANVAFQDKKEAIEVIRRSNKLTELTNLIGRFKESAITEQKKKAKHGAVEIKSVTVGNKVEDTLPSDRMNLINDTTKKDFYRRMTENQLMTYSKEAHKEKNKGPIIVCVDTSGSMGHSEEIWSKAMTIGILEIAQTQKRDFACIIYSGRADDPIVISKDEIAPQKIIECAERYHGGGTNFEGPLNKAIDLIKGSQFKDARQILAS